MINAILFSKDRACQLDCLLRSIQRNVANYTSIKWSVLYLATTPEYLKGYDRLLRGQYSWCTFLNEKQKGFKTSTLELLLDRIPYHMFLVDDDCFKSSWDPQDQKFEIFKNRKELLTLSLRMAPSYNFCYTQNATVSPPLLDREGVWRWKHLAGDWGYPMSLDGHIFRTNEILPLIRDIDFKNPNSLEAQLAHRPLSAPAMICYPEAKIINLPINRVQTVNKNRAGVAHPISIDELNRRFIEGEQISLEAITQAKGFNAPHFELPVRFEKQ